MLARDIATLTRQIMARWLEDEDGALTVPRDEHARAAIRVPRFTGVGVFVVFEVPDHLP
jgi:hypothetical protein